MRVGPLPDISDWRQHAALAVDVVAAILRVSPNTVRRMWKRGELLTIDADRCSRFSCRRVQDLVDGVVTEDVVDDDEIDREVARARVDLEQKRARG